MTERLADISQRIETSRQLGAVVDAMRGMAGSRAQQSRALLPAVRGFAGITARALDQARALGHAPDIAATACGQTALIVFGAEQGFAGAFVRQVLDATQDQFAHAHVFLLGSRSLALARERGHDPAWTCALPSRASAVPSTASELVDALYDHLGKAGAMAVTMVYPVWSAGVVVTRRALLPLDRVTLPETRRKGLPPLVNLGVAHLLESLVEEYVFAQLCEATMETFAAENEARMMTMAAAKTNIDGKLTTLRAQERRLRQEEVTAEVIELAAGARGR